MQFILKKIIPYKKELIAMFILFLFALLIRLPLLFTPFYRTPDAAEYLNLARNLNDGLGFIQSMKLQFFDNHPVITSVTHGRPVLTGIIFSLLLKLNNSPYFLQFFELITNSLTAVLFFILARRFIQFHLSFLASILVALSPNILISSRLLLSEPIFNFFILLILILLFLLKDSILKWIFIGFLTGLSYLTRNEGILIFAFIFIFYFKRSAKYSLLYFLSFFVTVSPYLLLNIFVNGTPFYTYNSYHFRVREFKTGIDNYGQVYPSAVTFISQNVIFVITKTFQTFLYHIKSILDLDSLGLLGIFLFPAIGLYFRKYILFWGIMGIILFSYGILWSALFEPARHFNLIYMLSLIPIFDVLSRMSKRSIFYSLVFLTIIFYTAFDIHRIRWARVIEPTLDTYAHPQNQKLYEWIDQNTNKMDIISSEVAWFVTIQTNRPGITFPENITNQNLYNTFIREYNVCYVVTEQKKDFLNQVAKKVFDSNTISVYSTGVCR